MLMNGEPKCVKLAPTTKCKHATNLEHSEFAAPLLITPFSLLGIALQQNFIVVGKLDVHCSGILR